jgi:hypothetical protein
MFFFSLTFIKTWIVISTWQQTNAQYWWFKMFIWGDKSCIPHFVDKQCQAESCQPVLLCLHFTYFCELFPKVNCWADSNKLTPHLRIENSRHPSESCTIYFSAWFQLCMVYCYRCLLMIFFKCETVFSSAFSKSSIPYWD